MSPSFSAKNGVRYRFYVSTALRGQKHRAGTVTRVSAAEIEGIIDEALPRKLEERGVLTEAVWERVERAVVGAKSIRVTLSSLNTDITPAETIDIPWNPKRPNRLDTSTLATNREPDQKLLQAIVRARTWLSDLANDCPAAPSPFH
jgi:site-specific DNA recombinase